MNFFLSDKFLKMFKKSQVMVNNLLKLKANLNSHYRYLQTGRFFTL